MGSSLKLSSLKDFVENLGVCVFGVASSEGFSGAPEGHRPWDLLPGARSVVVFGMEVPKGAVMSIPSIHYHTLYEQVNRMLVEAAYKLAAFIESKGYLALPLSPSEPDPARKVLRLKKGYKMVASFSHRHAAALAGIAELTPASYAVVKGYGPRVRFNSVITTAPVEGSVVRESGLRWGEVCKPGECGMPCVKACPPKALPGDGTVDQLKCRRYRLIETGRKYFERIIELDEKGVPPVRRLAMIQSRRQTIALCGLCVKACPLAFS